MQGAVQHLGRAATALTEKCTNRDCLAQKRAYKSNFKSVKKHYNDSVSLITNEVKRWQAETDQKEEEMLRQSERIKAAESAASMSTETEKQLRDRVGELEKQNAQLMHHNDELMESEQELKENHRLLVDAHKDCAAEIQSSNFAGHGQAGPPPCGCNSKRDLDSKGAIFLKKIVYQLDLDNPGLGLGLEKKMDVLRALYDRLDYVFPENRAAEIACRINSEVRDRKEAEKQREFELTLAGLRVENENLKQKTCKECRRLEKEIGNLKKDSFAARKKNHEMDVELNSHRQKYADLGKERERLCRENQSLLSQLKSRNHQIETFKNNLDAARKNEANIRKELEQFTSKKAELEQELEHVKKSNTNALNNELNAKLNSDLKQQTTAINALRQKVEQYKSQNEQLSTELNESYTRINQLETEYDEEMRQEETKRAEATHMMKRFRDERDELREEKDILEKEKAKLEDDNTKLMTEETKLKQDKDKLVAEKTKLEQEKNKLMTGKSKLEQEKNTLVMEKTKLEQEKNKLISAKTNLEQEKNTLVMEKTMLEHENSTLMTEKRKLEQDNNNLEAKKSMDKRSSKLLQYENDAKQRINDVAEKKRDLDQALLLINQTNRRLEQQTKKQQQSVATIATQTNIEQNDNIGTTTSTVQSSSSSVFVQKIDMVDTSFTPSPTPTRLSSAPMASYAFDLGTDEFDATVRCPQCPQVQRQLEHEKRKSKQLETSLHEQTQLADHLAGAVALLMADPTLAVDAARMRDEMSKVRDTIGAKRPRNE